MVPCSRAVEEHREAVALALPELIVFDQRRGGREHPIGLGAPQARRQQLVARFGGQIFEPDRVLTDLGAPDVGGQEDRHSEVRGGVHQRGQVGAGEYGRPPCTCGVAGCGWAAWRESDCLDVKRRFDF